MFPALREYTSTMYYQFCFTYHPNILLNKIKKKWILIQIKKPKQTNNKQTKNVLQNNNKTFTFLVKNYFIIDQIA